ncbi:hypothetical protein GCM10022226_23750 [Sphaerisporangium flaviroseum]|uniref:Uncharacterized protein n=1 Tax=Sphaerisporangium flaviroseum TaxID=509199 RepID=A0ABP7HW06_9ACTN
MRGEQRLGVAAQAQIGVDEHRARTGERGSEELQDTAEHHRHVPARLGMIFDMHGLTPLPPWSCLLDPRDTYLLADMRLLVSPSRRRALAPPL